MKLSDGEKLILTMLSEIYEHLGIKGDIDHKFVQSAIHSGQLWGLSWKYPGVFDAAEPTSEVRNEVLDILDMWNFIERGYAGLNPADQARLKAEAEPFGDHVKFPGFDGNNEVEHLGVAHFLVEDLDRFDAFDGRDLNSHAPLLDSYRRMLRIFLPMREKIMTDELSVGQLIALMKERIHPDHRKK